MLKLGDSFNVEPRRMLRFAVIRKTIWHAKTSDHWTIRRIQSDSHQPSLREDRRRRTMHRHEFECNQRF